MQHKMLDSRGKDGLSLEQVLQGGGRSVESQLEGLALRPEQVLEYIEVHMEQVGAGIHRDAHGAGGWGRRRQEGEEETGKGGGKQVG